MKKTILNIITIICIILIGWFAWSFIDIAKDNNEVNPTHSEYNAFVLLVK